MLVKINDKIPNHKTQKLILPVNYRIAGMIEARYPLIRHARPPGMNMTYFRILQTIKPCIFIFSVGDVLSQWYRTAI